MKSIRIIVDRFRSDHDATLSRVRAEALDGDVLYSCFGLEDEARAIKVYGETRIPAGVYKVGVRTEGGFHRRYSEDRRFRDIHEGMLHILDVPGFDWILIHVGNNDDDTAGCLLVGECADTKRMIITRSAAAYRALYLAVIGAAKAGRLVIEVQDNDGADDAPRALHAIGGAAA